MAEASNTTVTLQVHRFTPRPERAERARGGSPFAKKGSPFGGGSDSAARRRPRGKQWVPVDKTLELLDTPGILWPKFEDQTVGLRLALIGSIKDEILNVDELAVELVKFLKAEYPGLLAQRYEVSEENDIIELISDVAVNRKCLSKGGEPDYSKAAALIIDDFRSGKLGHITLERPEI